MKNLISGMVLAVILCGLYATAQQPHVTQTLPSATVKLNGASGGGGSGTGFTWDAGLDAWVFTPPSDTDATDIVTDNFSVLDSAENVLLGVATKIIAHVPLQVAGDTFLQLEEQELDASGAVVGSLVTCETTAGAVVATMTAGGAGDVGRFAIIRRSGANTCTVGVGSGQTLDGVTDGTTTVANGAWKTFVQTGDTAWVTQASYPTTGTISGLTTGNVPYASSATALADSPLYRVDANTLAQANSTTAQTLRVFKTNNGAAGAVGTNYAYLDMKSDANGGVFEWAKGGTGAGTFISFKVPASSYPAVWYVNGSQVGYVNPSGALNMTGGGAFGSHVTGCATCSIGQSGTQWQDGWYSRDLYANHLMGVGTAPTVAGSCGTSPTIAGKDSFFKITTGTGSPTSCTVTFGRAYSTAPVCVANAATTTTALLMTTTTTTAVVSSAALTAGEVLHVMCGGF